VVVDRAQDLVVMHLAFSAGWPEASTAVILVRRVSEDISALKPENT
jgi:hypothetical protein